MLLVTNSVRSANWRKMYTYTIKREKYKATSHLLRETVINTYSMSLSTHESTVR